MAASHSHYMLYPLLSVLRCCVLYCCLCCCNLTTLFLGRQGRAILLLWATAATLKKAPRNADIPYHGKGIGYVISCVKRWRDWVQQIWWLGNFSLWTSLRSKRRGTWKVWKSVVSENSWLISDKTFPRFNVKYLGVGTLHNEVWTCLRFLSYSLESMDSFYQWLYLIIAVDIFYYFFHSWVVWHLKSLKCLLDQLLT